MSHFGDRTEHTQKQVTIEIARIIDETWSFRCWISHAPWRWRQKRSTCAHAIQSILSEPLANISELGLGMRYFRKSNQMLHVRYSLNIFSKKSANCFLGGFDSLLASSRKVFHGFFINTTSAQDPLSKSSLPHVSNIEIFYLKFHPQISDVLLV